MAATARSKSAALGGRPGSARSTCAPASSSSAGDALAVGHRDHGAGRAQGGAAAETAGGSACGAVCAPEECCEAKWVIWMSRGRPAAIPASSGEAGVVDVHVDPPQAVAADHHQAVAAAALAELVEPAPQLGHRALGRLQQVDDLELGLRAGPGAATGSAGAARDGQPPLPEGAARVEAAGVGGERVQDHDQAQAPGVDHAGLAQDVELLGGAAQRLAGAGRRGLRDVGQGVVRGAAGSAPAPAPSPRGLATGTRAAQLARSPRPRRRGRLRGGRGHRQDRPGGRPGDRVVGRARPPRPGRRPAPRRRPPSRCSGRRRRRAAAG